MKRYVALIASLICVSGLFAEDVELGGLKSPAPKDWKFTEPANKAMRILQATLPKAEGDKDDAELVVFFFGKGGGGDVKSNFNRWKGSMIAPEGKNIDDVAKTGKLTTADDKVTFHTIDMTGTYKFKAQPFNPNSPTTEKAEYRFIGIIMEGENGPFFIRITGPEKTVAKHYKAMEEWLKAFK